MVDVGSIVYIKDVNKKQLLLEIIERIGCTKSIQPSKEVRIVSVIQSLTEKPWAVLLTPRIKNIDTQ